MVSTLLARDERLDVDPKAAVRGLVLPGGPGATIWDPSADRRLIAGGAGPGPILVVDDDRGILDVVSDILLSEGYPVEQATNGLEALQVIARTRPSLVLLDMRMPVLDGWGFVAQLGVAGISLPIVVMTAAQDARQWSREIAATDYLAKPFDLIALLRIVERHRAH